MYVFRRRDAVNHSSVFLQEMRPHTISPSQQKQYPELFASRRNMPPALNSLVQKKEQTIYELQN